MVAALFEVDPVTDERTDSFGRDRNSTEGPTSSIRFLRCPEVCARTGLSRTTLWKLERQGQFPARRVLTANTVGWLAAEVEEWIVTRSPRPSARPWERSARTEPPIVAGTPRRPQASL